MTRQEIEALLRLLVEWERKEISLLMLTRRKPQRDGHAQPPGPRPVCREHTNQRGGILPLRCGYTDYPLIGKPVSI
jgi:hypothetical protein